MKHQYKLLILIFAMPILSAAQSNYKPGAVVNSKGDTVRGFIDLREWSSNPEAISFKAAPSDAQPQNFTASDINFFSITDIVTYHSFTCSISTDDVNTQNLNTYRDTGFKTATVFLKVLQKGKNAALYSYTDRLKTRYYIGEAPAYAPKELVYRIYTTGGATTSTGNVVTESTYRTQLFNLATKYNVLNNDLTNSLQTANYNESEMVAAVSKINNISKAEYKKKYADKTKYRFYLSGFANIATISSVSSQSPYVAYGGPASQTTVQPGASVGISIIPNPATDKVELRLDLGLLPVKYDAHYLYNPEAPEGGTGGVQQETSFTQLSIAATPHVLWNFYNTDKLKIYAGGGLAFVSFHGTKFYSNGSTAIANGSVPDYFNAFDTGIALKAGVRLGSNIEIFGNYITKMSSSRDAYYQFMNTSAQIGLIYLFGK